MNRQSKADLVSKEQDGWGVVDADGEIVLWTVVPSRIGAIRNRLTMMGARVTEAATDEQVEDFWRNHTGGKEEVARVRVSMLLN